MNDKELQAELDELERTDPAVKAASDALDHACEKIRGFDPRPMCLIHFEREPCLTCHAYIAAGL